MIKTTKQKGEFGMKRTVYEAPVTELFRIELEGAFMSASVVNDEKQSTTGTIGHEIGAEIDADDMGWNTNENPWG